MSFDNITIDIHSRFRKIQELHLKFAIYLIFQGAYRGGKFVLLIRRAYIQGGLYSGFYGIFPHFSILSKFSSPQSLGLTLLEPYHDQEHLLAFILQCDLRSFFPEFIFQLQQSFKTYLCAPLMSTQSASPSSISAEEKKQLQFP